MNRICLVLFLTIILSGCKKQNNNQLINPIPTPSYTPIHLESSSFKLGNMAAGQEDTFTLNFNKPINLSYVFLKSNNCLPDINSIVLNGGKTVKFFTILCFGLGKKNTFEYSVKDSSGKYLKDSITFNYYSRQLPIFGPEIKFKISDDNKFCWATTQNPYQISCIGLEDTNYKRVYNLNFKPWEFCFNSQNQKLYLLSYPASTNVNSDKIYVMDTSSGNIEKTITVQQDIYDDPTKHIRVNHIAFGNNGYGVLLTETREYSFHGRWRIIDSRFNDSIYAHPSWILAQNTVGGSSNLIEFSSCFKNFNGTKLLLKPTNLSGNVEVLDCNSGFISEISFLSPNPNHYIVPNRIYDKLFVASYGFQSILSSGSWINASFFDDRYSETADFSYRRNENNFIYYRNRDPNYSFEILNYVNQQIVMKTNVNSDFIDITSSTDGKFIIAQTNAGLFQFNTDMLYP